MLITRENVVYHDFLVVFPKYFQKTIFPRVVKSRDCLVKVKDGPSDFGTKIFTRIQKNHPYTPKAL